MKVLKFKGLLQNKTWISPAYVQLSAKGKIDAITDSFHGEVSEVVDGLAIPAFPNAHSHSFQYAMSGLGEVHAEGSEPDDFWSWREAMYNLALSVNPDEFEAIATLLYAEMIRHGYSSVAEFHYVHHDKNGEHYEHLAELGKRLVLAAKKTGLKITLIPIFYQKGGFGQEPGVKQRRFISPTFDDYLKLYKASEEACSLYEDAHVSPGIHSMRGVKMEDIVKLADHFKDSNKAFHIHISEQLKEIEDSLAYLGKRPVEWLIDNIELSDKFQLVHATHLTDKETTDLAATGAQVVLCPSTEGNLGDGLFPLKKFQNAKGSWCIGTDSHIGLNPLEELRILDYGQRLISHKRNTYFNLIEGNSGLYAMEHAIHKGRKAVNNFQKDFFTIGEDFDALVYNFKKPLLQTASPKYWMSTILYSTDQSDALGTILKGEWIVKENKHRLQNEIDAVFSEKINALKARR